MTLLNNSMVLAKQGIANYFLKKPFCISFEITYNCNARCQHCHLGEPIMNEHRATPERYGEIGEMFKPVVAQVSGGEPLLRKDLDLIIKSLKKPNSSPFIILTTNGALLTEKRYRELRQAGVNEFSLSLDYPDEFHDEFRGIPGLFNRIKTLLENIISEKNKSITLSCVIQRDNFRKLLQLASLAREWKVNLNFSTYTWLRTKRKDLMLMKEDIGEFKKILSRLLEFKRQHKTIVTSEYVFRKMIEYFENEGIPQCRAGEKFLVVNPDGTLSPCGLIIKKYHSQKEMRQDFAKNNACKYCYTSIRANTEKPVRYLIEDNLKSFKQKIQSTSRYAGNEILS